MFWTARRQRKIGRRHREILGDRRQKQSETLAYPHAEREQERGPDQDQPSLAAARGNRSWHSGSDPKRVTQSYLTVDANQPQAREGRLAFGLTIQLTLLGHADEVIEKKLSQCGN